MRAYLFMMLVGLSVVFSSCGDDEPYVKPLNKLTKITCVKNEHTPLFTVDIAYTPEGEISSIQMNQSETWQFVRVQHVLNVIGDPSVVRTDYAYSGNVIVNKSVWQKNIYDPTAEYTSDVYSYRYNHNKLAYADLKMKWPKEGGKGYSEMNYPQDEKYDWDNNGNMISFTKDKRVMAYQYESSMTRPVNFPFFVCGTFDPTQFDSFSPLNFSMGTLSRNMPTSAYSYTIPEVNQKQVEYTFEYIATLSDYLTGMIIREVRHEANGDVKNVYAYTFEYNFEPAS